MKSLSIIAACPDLEGDIFNQVRMLCASPADVLVLPEYLLELSGFEPFVIPGKFVVFGSKITGGRNRLFLSDGLDVHAYDKQRLTPSESHLQAGREPAVFNFKGCKIAVLVCFDIEFPELAAQLRPHAPELLLVPAATETNLGYERVNRCASARSVELGCAVITCHLIGQSQVTLVGSNVGCHHMYLPSQSLFSDHQRHAGFVQPHRGGHIRADFSIPIDAIRRQRALIGETNPSLG